MTIVVVGDLRFRFTLDMLMDALGATWLILRNPNNLAFSDELLRYYPVVALGREAAKKLKEQDVKCFTLPPASASPKKFDNQLAKCKAWVIRGTK